MFELYCTLTDELGSRVVPTGHAFHDEIAAEHCQARLSAAYPENRIWVEFVPAQDAWNGY